MMRRKLFFLLPFFSLSAVAQSVSLLVGDNYVALPAQQTQSEVRPGWRIVDIQLKNKVTRYLAGAKALQLADARPTFRIEPAEGQTLVDYAVMRLAAKRQYRKLHSPLLIANAYTRIEPAAFRITPQGDKYFICQPIQALDSGQYVIVHLAQTPIQPLGDYVVYPFWIP